ncbi:Putative ribonuclease H protein At1g65750 [Linum perenne]
MSLFLYPKKMISHMNSVQRRFFWSGPMKKKSIHWCKGSKICDSGRNGWLGFREFETFNKALLARQGWQLINQPNAT